MPPREPEFGEQKVDHSEMGLLEAFRAKPAALRP